MPSAHSMVRNSENRPDLEDDPVPDHLVCIVLITRSIVRAQTNLVRVQYQ